MRLSTLLLLLLLPQSLLALFLPLKPINTAGTVALAGGVGAIGALGAWLTKRDTVYTPEPGSLQDKTIVITGGSTGLGLESAKRLAYGGATIVLTARSESKGEAAVQKVLDYLKEQKIDNTAVSYQVVDLDDLSSVQEAVDWNTNLDKIDVLLNNAGCMALPQRELTQDGIERQMQSNHLGHFALTALLAPKFTEMARIINVASSAHQMTKSTNGMQFDYFWTGKPDYAPWKSYGQSKLANILFTQELQRRIDASGKQWSAVTLHPGVIATDLWRNSLDKKENNMLSQAVGKAIKVAFKTPEQGASTQIFLAAGAEEEDVRGKYLMDCKVAPLEAFATSKDAAKRLWTESEEKSGIKFTL
jgi:NAD(P)-dependent dehydrogenase (short-subunit alcohol dehydrogenase family)